LNIESEGNPMKASLGVSLVLCGAMAFSLGLSKAQITKTTGDATSHQSTATVEGLVRDIACPIQNLEASATHLSMKCLRECARNGSPLIILTKDGELYTPISGKMPDTDQRPVLMPFVGKYVRATGTVYERKGTHAIVISEIKELKDVHLTIEDQ
jgi:hypothetical protein